MTPIHRTPNEPLAIIVADDVEEIRQLVGQWFQDMGHAVTCAASGREVIKLLMNQTCDLVVTDILMPDGDGLDVIMGVKRKSPGTRILAFSGGGRYMATDDALSLAKAIGADGMVPKPFNRAQFMEAVRRIIPGAVRDQRAG